MAPNATRQCPNIHPESLGIMRSRTAKVTDAMNRRAATDWRRVFALDLRALALFRIGIGVLLLLTLATLWPEIPAFYTDEGILPRWARGELNSEESFPSLCWQISPYMWAGNTQAVQGIFVVQGLVALLLAAGWNSRWMAFASWLLLVGLQARNPQIMQAGDEILRNMLFFSMFLPLGARYSLDARRGTRPGLRPDLPALDRSVADFSIAELPVSILNLGSAAFILQLLCVYFFTGLLKSDPVWRTQLSAVHYSMHVDHFTTALGYRLASIPELTKLVTLVTMVLEHAGPVLLLLPGVGWRIRLMLVLAFMGFHVGIGLCMSLGLFPLTCIICWLALVPTPAIDACIRWGNARDCSMARVAASGHERVAVEIPQYAEEMRLTLASQILLSMILAYMFLINGIRLNGLGVYANLGDGPIRTIGEAAQVNQYWSMFAARPPIFGGWYDMRATLSDGREVNLWNPDQPVQESRPVLVSAMYPSSRWRKTCVVLYERHSPTHRACLGEYLVRRYERLHPQAHVVDACIILRAAVSPSPDQGAKPTRETIIPVVLWQRSREIDDPREQLAVLVRMD
ncbi:MAG: hypothetical protein ACK553_01570 [Planctomycetota bacterium]